MSPSQATAKTSASKPKATKTATKPTTPSKKAAVQPESVEAADSKAAKLSKKAAPKPKTGIEARVTKAKSSPTRVYGEKERAAEKLSKGKTRGSYNKAVDNVQKHIYHLYGKEFKGGYGEAKVGKVLKYLDKKTKNQIKSGPIEETDDESAESASESEWEKEEEKKKEKPVSKKKMAAKK